MPHCFCMTQQTFVYQTFTLFHLPRKIPFILPLKSQPHIQLLFSSGQHISLNCLTSCGSHILMEPHTQVIKYDFLLLICLIPAKKTSKDRGKISIPQLCKNIYIGICKQYQNLTKILIKCGQREKNLIIIFLQAIKRYYLQEKKKDISMLFRKY